MEPHGEVRAMNGTMQALCAVRGTVALETVARPARGTGSALVRVTHALVTPLEREVMRGLGAADAGSRILGTSCVGMVEDAPEGCAVPRGTRVAVHPVFSCGACERCRGGLALHCVARSIVGIDAAAGGCAEWIAVPPSACVPLPAGLDEAAAVFAVHLARATEAVRRGGIDRRTYASVLGDDLLAVLTCLVACEENPLARLVATREETLKVAEQFGIRHRALAETGRRGDQELVIDTTGSAESIEAATRMARPRGHVVVAGLSARAPVAVDLSRLALDEIEVHGSGFGPLAGAIERLARRAVDPAPLVTRRVGLAEGAKAVLSAADAGQFATLVQVGRP
ncbi:MAG: alcohol dehydrogenase catalytic domain-containing protein [Phycisphaerales bacterium]